MILSFEPPPQKTKKNLLPEKKKKENLLLLLLFIYIPRNEQCFVTVGVRLGGARGSYIVNVRSACAEWGDGGCVRAFARGGVGGGGGGGYETTRIRYDTIRDPGVGGGGGVY